MTGRRGASPASGAQPVRNRAATTPAKTPPRLSRQARRPMKILLSCLLFSNLLCFLLFALDKRKSQRGPRRIAEKTLHLATLPGAAPGAWAAILLLHHKNRKPLSGALPWC